MAKPNLTTKNSILETEYNKHFQKKTMLELQIALQKELDPNEKSAKRILKTAANGQPISTEEITRAEHITILEKELEDVELVLKVINSQFEE